jgi:deazaflavin-dependent oxidoreductase (nitroreductase family)
MSAVAKTAWRLITKGITGTHAAIYRASGGKVVGRMFNSPVLLLITTGRKTGKERTTPLLYLEDGENLVVVASVGGAPKHPDWYWNLIADPEARVEIGDRTLRIRAQEAQDEEKSRLWARLAEMYPPYEDYQKRTKREIPVLVLHPLINRGDRRGEHRVKTITREELKEKMDRGDDFVLLEALGEKSYRRVHLPGAIRFQNVDLAPKLLPDKGAEIVAYCSNFN